MMTTPDPCGFVGGVDSVACSASRANSVPVPERVPVLQEAVLRANSTAYERLVRTVADLWRAGDAEATLGAVSRASVFCSAFHPGRFADGAIENIAYEIGRGHLCATSEARGNGQLRGRRRVLHVVTQLSSIGGHTRMLHHWVRNDRSSSHGVLVVDQRGRAVPVWLSQAVQGAGGHLTICDPSSSRLARAAVVRRLARNEADLVVLHHDAIDVVPTVAFAADGGPPVTVLNHADHSFWPGSSVADAIIDLRSAASAISAERRFANCSAVLPIPLADPALPITRLEARRMLGIPAEQHLLLTVGRKLKFRPCGSHDFVATAGRILERAREAHLYIVGATDRDMAPYLRAPPHERIHFLGVIGDPAPWQAAADVYLESFPFGSNTALLEAALAGLPVVPAYAPLSPLLVAGNDSLNDLLPNPASEEAYIERVCTLVGDPCGRVFFGESLRERVRSHHVGDGWLDRLSALYQCTDPLVHRPSPIPTTECSTSGADIGLSLWHVMADGRTNHRVGSSLDPAALLRHAAFVAKDAGDYASARQKAGRAVLAGPFEAESWWLLGASALGRWAPVVRSWLRLIAPVPRTAVPTSGPSQGCPHRRVTAKLLRTPSVAMGGSTGDPKVLVAARVLGASGQPWLTRQITGLGDFDKVLMCWERRRPPADDPFAGYVVHVMEQEAAPYDGKRRWWYRLRNLIGGNFYGAVGRDNQELAEVLRQERPDVILGYFGDVALRVLPAAQREGIPVIAYLHGDFLFRSNRWYRRSLKRCLDQFSCIAVVTEAERLWLREQAVPAEKIHVIPCGAPVDLFRPAKRREGGSIRFVMCSRLAEEKGCETAIRAFALVKSVPIDAELQIFGDGPSRAHLEQLVEALRITDSATFHGYVGERQLAGLLPSCDIFIQHSLTKEGSPVSIAEAMACGLPVVATPVGGITQQVIDGETGFLVKERDVGAMASAMQRLAMDRQLRSKMGLAARSRAIGCYDSAYQIRQLRRVICQVVTAEEGSAR